MKTFLPPFIAFFVFGIFVILNAFVHPMHVGDMGGGNLHAFMACFYYCWPLYALCALLTQWIIMVPIWEGRNGDRPAQGKFLVFIYTCIVCLLFAAAIGYCIWDKRSGRWHLIGLVTDMYFIQVVYWVINIFIMILFDGKHEIKDHHEHSEVAAA